MSIVALCSSGGDHRSVRDVNNQVSVVLLGTDHVTHAKTTHSKHNQTLNKSYIQISHF